MKFYCIQEASYVDTHLQRKRVRNKFSCCKKKLMWTLKKKNFQAFAETASFFKCSINTCNETSSVNTAGAEPS